MYVILLIDPTPVGVAETKTAETGHIDINPSVLYRLVDDHEVEQDALHLKRTFPVMRVIFFEEPKHLTKLRLAAATNPSKEN